MGPIYVGCRNLESPNHILRQLLFMKKLLLFSLSFAGTLAIAQKNKDAAKFASTITQAGLREKLTIVASAEMEGRETATPGQKRAAVYIEEKFKSFGLKPGNGNSYQQVYPVFQDELKEAKLTLYNLSFDFDKHFSVSLNGAINGSWNLKDIAFVSYGIVDSTRNDYKGIDVKGKWVMLLDISPADIEKGEGFTPTNSRFGGGGLNAKISTARKNGAVGIIIVSKSFNADNRPAANRTGNMYMKKEGAQGNTSPIISVSYQAAASLLTKMLPTYTSLKDVNTGIYATNANISINKSTNNLESSNVMGLLEGTDKKDEYVILTGHYDHLGMRNGVIYYGADDDGSGTVSVLQMAEAFSEAKKKGKGPRRSILFMTVSGEEKGLWGSDYYASHPVYPLGKTTVDLNTDMVGRIDPAYKGDSMNYVYAIGEDKLSSDLQKITDSINVTAKLELDRRYNDPKDPNRFYYRSDHYNFAKNGVPIIFYFDGVHKDYHRPTDTVEKINFDLMEKRVRLIFNTAWVMANREEMLKRDLPLNMPTTR